MCIKVCSLPFCSENNINLNYSFSGMPRLDVHNTTKYYYFDRNIRVDNLKFDRLLFHNNNEPLEMVKLHEPPLLIAAIRKHKEILVDEINGISWDNFFNSVYRKSKNNAIKGKHVIFYLLALTHFTFICYFYRQITF